jgi:4-amino-4-deoxy-L-arabinose transferase-like glycosyltransferase
MAVSFSRTHVPAALGLLLVIGLFSAPLFNNLGGLDLENDEASYSYQVDRILETGHWLSPRGIPSDTDFVEKPPVMFWLVAGGIKSGMLPHNNAGLRFMAALCGAIAFVYVYLLGCRLQGPVAGVLAVLILFTYAPLLFNHGLRTNNMEGALFLSYCAGMYHVVRWLDTRANVGSRGHAWAAMLAFTLGFMTKFVAAAFLPMLWMIAVLAREDRATLVRARWREWIGPIVFAAIIIPPWFIYQTIRLRSEFWHILIGEHVYQRFTTGLDPSHLKPWHFYVTQLWTESSIVATRWIIVAGLVSLAIRALAGKDWLARLVLAWAIVPIMLISIGSSKIYYYADPFVPPMALAAGWLAGEVLRRLSRSAFVSAPWPGQSAIDARLPSALQAAFALIAFAAVVIAAWTLWLGRFTIMVDHVRVFVNASVVRPLLLAVGLAMLAGSWRPWFLTAVAGVVLLPLYPIDRYAPTWRETAVIHNPLTTVRDCVKAQIASGAPLSRGTYIGSGPIPTHAFYYYLRTLGPFFFREDGLSDEVRARLFDSSRQSLVVLSKKDYDMWDQRLRSATPPGQLSPLMPSAVAAPLDSVVVMPGAYEVCALPARVASGESPAPVVR